jgi:Tfp pilus assembly protein PilF
MAQPPGGRGVSRDASTLFRTFLSLFLAISLLTPPFASAQPAAQDRPQQEPAQPPLPAEARPPLESRYSRPAEREIQFQEGLLRYSRGQLQQAEADFRAVIAEDPADAEAHYHLGLSLLDQNLPREAVESFTTSLRLDPTADEVRAARATANIRLRNLDAAREDLAVLEPDPRWRSLVDYLTGQLLYAEGDLEGAARSFARARAAGSTEAEPAGFYEGLTYLRMRELVRARSSFRDAALGADRDPTVAAAARQLDAVLAEQQRAVRPWEVQITLAYEWDSNVIQISPDIPTPIGISDESDSRILLQPRGSYSFIRTGRLDAGVEASGYFTWHFDLNDFDVASYQAGPYANYRLRDNLYLSARYGFNYIEVGREEFLIRHLITPQVTLIQPDFGYTSVYYQFQARQFQGTPATPDFDRDGPLHAMGVVQGIQLPEFFRDAGRANLELSYRFEHQDTEGADFEGNFHSLGATLYTPLPFWKLRHDIGVSVDFDRYSNPNSIDADNSRRRDWEFNVVTGITRELNRNWAVRVDYGYTYHDSNVQTAAGQNLFDFDRHQVGVRLIFSY